MCLMQRQFANRLLHYIQSVLNVMYGAAQQPHISGSLFLQAVCMLAIVAQADALDQFFTAEAVQLLMNLLYLLIGTFCFILNDFCEVERIPTSWNCSLRFRLISGSKSHVDVLWITGAPTKLFCSRPRIIWNGPSALTLKMTLAMSNCWRVPMEWKIMIASFIFAASFLMLPFDKCSLAVHWAPNLKHDLTYYLNCSITLINVWNRIYTAEWICVINMLRLVSIKRL